MKKFIKWAFIILILKIILVYNIPIFDRGLSLHDDYLMINMAKNLIEGIWLGDFNEYVFIKGITYPLFLAINYVFHISSNIANTLLYFISCLLFIISIKDLISKFWQRILIFLIMFLSPISYALQTFQRAYRDDIYYSLILILVSAYIGIYLRIKENKKIKKWIILAIVSFVLSWFCREDTIWILPFMILWSIVIYFTKNNIIGKRLKIVYLVSPYIVCILCGVFLGYINYLVYGIFAINDMQYSSYTRAYKAMTQIKTQNNYTKVALSREAIEKLYKECPSFLELKPYYNGNGDVYEGKEGKMWLDLSHKWRENNTFPSNEIGASHSMWAFRDMVDKAGYYRTAREANEYYNRLYNEIEIAFKEGRLKKRDEIRIPLFTQMNIMDLNLLATTMNKSLKYVISYSDEDNIIRPLYYKENYIPYKELYEVILREKAMPVKNSYISGWIVSNRNITDAFIENNKNEKIKKIKWLDSADVKRYFEEKNLIYKNYDKARFGESFLSYSEEAPYYITLYDDNKQIKKILITDLNNNNLDNNVSYYFDNVHLEKNQKSFIEYKVEILQEISKIYALINIKITYISILFLILGTGYLIINKNNQNKKLNNIIYILFAIMIVFFLRIFTISYNTITAFYSIFYAYLSPCYPLLAAFNGLSIILFFYFAKNIRRSK